MGAHRIRHFGKTFTVRHLMAYVGTVGLPFPVLAAMFPFPTVGRRHCNRLWTLSSSWPWSTIPDSLLKIKRRLLQCHRLTVPEILEFPVWLLQCSTAVSGFPPVLH